MILPNLTHISNDKSSTSPIHVAQNVFQALYTLQLYIYIYIAVIIAIKNLSTISI